MWSAATPVAAFFKAGVRAGLSSSQNRIQSCEDEIELRSRQLADAIRQQPLIDRQDLRCVGHRIIREIGDLRGEEYVSGKVSQSDIGRERNAYHCLDATTVESIALDDDDRPAISGSRSDGDRKVRPPDLSLRDHHSVFSRIRRPAAAENSSLGSPNSSITRLIASVTSSGACRAMYSRKAALNTSLRVRRERRASRSTFSNTSSGMETAVFIP